MRTIRFGIIGGGLMGKEFFSAAQRWCHLEADIPKPEIIGIAAPSEATRNWFTRFPGVKYSFADYKELLAQKDIDAIYCAVPHHLHESIYINIIRAKKHLLGEKPFGIDKTANARILEELEKHPEVFVRCVSQYPYYPACQELIRWFEEEKFGKIFEIRAGFHHSSDMDTQKPLNWKRMVEYNGVYGCMGDLGIHTQHVPFRMGVRPNRVYATLSNIVEERPDGKGEMAPCKTWDNATILCECTGKKGEEFPMILSTKRLSPGSTNEWFLQVDGMKASAKFSTADSNAFYYTDAWQKEQAWCRLVMGYKPMIPAVTGGIFEFGFSDAIQQMFAAFIAELDGQDVFFGCFRPEETRISHALQTTALLSQKMHCAIGMS